MNEEKRRYAHGVMVYQCEECGEVFTMKLEMGIEERKDGIPVENYKPSPFIIRCPYCRGAAKDLFFRALHFPEPRPIRHGERFFANEETCDCGVPTRLGMEWDVPKLLDDPAVSRKSARDCNGDVIRIHDIVRLADHVMDIEGLELLAGFLRSERGMIDDILRDGRYALVDFPGTVFRAILLEPKDLKFISHDNWNAEEYAKQIAGK